MFHRNSNTLYDLSDYGDFAPTMYVYGRCSSLNRVNTELDKDKNPVEPGHLRIYIENMTKICEHIFHKWFQNPLAFFPSPEAVKLFNVV